jgi:beta-alanine degradation protein BauB
VYHAEGRTDRQIENSRARVTRHKMAPGAHTGFHRHEYDYVIVPITDGRMRIVEGDRESVNELTAGGAYFRPAGIEHDVINGADKELIFVESKSFADPGERRWPRRSVHSRAYCSARRRSGRLHQRRLCPAALRRGHR